MSMYGAIMIGREQIPLDENAGSKGAWRLSLHKPWISRNYIILSLIHYTCDVEPDHFGLHTCAVRNVKWVRRNHMERCFVIVVGWLKSLL